jgi:protoporphyrinogen oxidase
MKDRNVYIIGAGISGLVAAIELENAGFSPVILEGSDRIGGRIKTDIEQGFFLDHGFQVLLTAYPEAKRYLDYQKLELKVFDSGAIILQPGHLMTLHDPLRNPAHLLTMLFSEVGTMKDKFKIAQLTRHLKSKSIEEIFIGEESSTLEFLRNYGFSEKIIYNFFTPFFRGIFLEEGLTTSSRMFKFVFKMFASGYAAIPKKGMQAIPDHLFNQLKSTKIKLNQKVDKIELNKISLANGETIQADAIILTSSPNGLITDVPSVVKGYRKVINVYFSLEKSFFAAPMIGLVPGNNFFTNNLVFMTDVNSSYAEDGKALLSVSVIKPVDNLNELLQIISKELEILTGVQAQHFKHVKTYEINQALPDIKVLKNEVSHQPVKLNSHVYLAGDQMLNASINGAMAAGRKAAEALLMDIM